MLYLSIISSNVYYIYWWQSLSNIIGLLRSIINRQNSLPIIEVIFVIIVHSFKLNLKIFVIVLLQSVNSTCFYCWTLIVKMWKRSCTERGVMAWWLWWSLARLVPTRTIHSNSSTWTIYRMMWKPRTVFSSQPHWTVRSPFGCEDTTMRSWSIVLYWA